MDYSFSIGNWEAGLREEVIGRNGFPGFSFLPSLSFVRFENDREKFLWLVVSGRAVVC